MNAEKQIAKLLTQEQKTLAIAESCTGGLVSNMLTNIPGSSNFFLLGVIPYNNRFKKELLNVPLKILAAKGAVSKETALLMSQNIRRLAKTSFGLSITGIAGPAGATRGKPAGLVYIALSSLKKDICKKFLFKGTRVSIKKQAAISALKLLEKNL